MKKTELKQALDAQRYFLVSLQVTLMQMGVFPSEYKIIEINLDNLWETTQLIADDLSIELLTADEIIKTGRDLMALEKLYSMKVND